MRCPPFVTYQIKIPTQIYNNVYQLGKAEFERTTIELWKRHLIERKKSLRKFHMSNIVKAISKSAAIRLRQRPQPEGGAGD